MKAYSYFIFILINFVVCAIAILAAWLTHGLALGKMFPAGFVVGGVVYIIGLAMVIGRYTCLKCAASLFPNWFLSRGIPGPKACQKCGHFSWKL